MDPFAVNKNGDEKICIVGAGLVGSMLSIILAQSGFEIEVFEKRKDPRLDDKTRGRSIAMSISNRGWKALRMIGLENEVRKNTNPKHSRMVHLPNGSVQAQEYGKDGQTINTINRRYLNITLIDKALNTGKVKMFFNHDCEYIDEESGEIIFRNNETDEKINKVFTRIIGADGNFSAVGGLLAKRNLIEHNRMTLIYGYKELRIPPDEKGDFAIENHYVHVWPRQNAILIALPGLENEFICTLFLPLEGDNSIDTIQSDKSLLNLFKENFSDVIPLIPNLQEQFFNNPTSHITAVKAFPWNYKDKILLIGDAAHAIAPFYAMGMNVGFEDCTTFLEMLVKNDYSFARTFEQFGTKRKLDTDAIAELSFRNFNNISKSPDPTYNVKWELERKIWHLIPEKWMPAYAMIAFTNMPLSKVARQKEKQDKILDELVKSNQNILELPDGILLELVEGVLTRKTAETEISA